MEDGQRKGALVLPIDVNRSAWDCTLVSSEVPVRRERAEQGARAFVRTLAVRMGFRYVKGLGVREQEQLAQVSRPVRLAEDFARQSGLGLHALVALAEVGAFDSLGLTRRESLWRVRAAARGARDGLRSEPGSKTPALPTLDLPEQVLWDYQGAQHSARGHPVESLRMVLSGRGVVDARALRDVPHGRRVDCVGLVICRQRPGTATGVVFLTLEDEHGFVNVVVWSQVFERFQRVVRTARLLGVRGPVQVAESVVHVIAEDLYLPELDAEAISHKSRDFH